MKINKLLTEVYHSSYPKWVKDVLDSQSHKLQNLNKISTNYQTTNPLNLPIMVNSIKIDFNKDPFIEGLPEVIDSNTFIFCVFLSSKYDKKDNGIFYAILTNTFMSSCPIKDANKMAVGSFFDCLFNIDLSDREVIPKKEGLSPKYLYDITIKDLPDYTFGLGYIKGNTGVNIENKINRVKNLQGVSDRNSFKQYKQYYNDESSMVDGEYGKAWNSSITDARKGSISLNKDNDDNIYGDIDINDISIRWLTKQGYDKSGNIYDPNRLITKYTSKVAEEGKPFKIITLLFKQCELAKQAILNFLSNSDNILYHTIINEAITKVAYYINVLKNTEIAFNANPDSFVLKLDDIQEMYQTLTKIIDDLNNFKPQTKNESLLLEGKNYQQTFEKFAEKLQSSNLKNNEEASNVSLLFLKLMEADPTFNAANNSSTGDYGEWIIRQYFNKNVYFNHSNLSNWDVKLIYDKENNTISDETSNLPFPTTEEDDEELTVNSLLDEFNSNKKIIPQKDIGTYKTPWQLKEAIEAAIEADTNKPVIQNEKMQGKNIPEAKLVFKDDKYTVYIPLSYEGSRNLGRNTGWCITQLPENNGESFYNEYLIRGGYYYFIFDRRDKNRKFLFHFESNQFEAPHKNGNRVWVDPKEVINDDEELKSFLGMTLNTQRDEFIDFILDENSKYSRMNYKFLNNLVIKTSEISNGRFRSCEIKNIIFEGPLQKIGAKAFQDAYMHCDIILPNTLEQIDSEAFSDCCFSDNYKLKIPNSVQSLGANCLAIDTENEENSGLEIANLDNLTSLGAQHITSTLRAKEFLESFKNSKVESFYNLYFMNITESLKIILPKTLQSIHADNIKVLYEAENCTLQVVFPPSLHVIPSAHLPIHATNHGNRGNIIYLVPSKKMYEIMRQIYYESNLIIKIRGEG